MVQNIRTAVGIGLFSLLTAIPALSQEVATLALRSGERPSGELIDMNNSGLILRINGEDRAYPASEVTAIEFAVGSVPGDAQNRIDSGRPFVLLRNGQVIDGRLNDISGTRPLRLSIDTPSGARDFNSSEVAQVWMNPASRSAGNGAAANPGTSSQAPAGSITVPANVAWTETGITVAGSATLAVAATGDIIIAPDVSSGIAGNAAATPNFGNRPVPSAPAGALIGKIGNGAPFLIGSTDRVNVRGVGRLFVGVNDGNVSDNTGNFVLTINRAAR